MIERIAQGESKVLEFKERLPESKKYIKTILAFANTSGGQLLIGVRDDKTIVGVEPDEAIRMMDRISNAISDLCEPMIMPNIYLISLEGKTIIVVEVYPSKNTPHFIKGEGMENGTYIRVGATTRRYKPSIKATGRNRRKEPSASVGVKRKSLEESMNEILGYMEKDVPYSRYEIMLKLAIKESRAREILRQLVRQEKLIVVGKGKETRYQKKSA